MSSGDSLFLGCTVFHFLKSVCLIWLTLFFKIFFFNLDHFWSLYWLHYNIASVFMFWFFGLEACWILAPWPLDQQVRSWLIDSCRQIWVLIKKKHTKKFLHSWSSCIIHILLYLLPKLTAMPTSSLCFKARKRFVKSFPSPLGCCSHFSFTVLFHLSCKARNRIRIHLCLLCKRGIIIMHAQSVVGDQVLVANKWKCLGFPFLVWKHPLILY